MTKEDQHGAHNYHPLPVVWSRAEGCVVWDVDGKEHLDFLAAYSAVNQGHCHPKIVAAAVEQMGRLTISSRAFYSDRLGDFEEFATKLFGFDKMLPMNTGAEAVETALKLARRWAYSVKGVEKNCAKVLWASENFHGRTLAIVSASTDPESKGDFGPFMPGFPVVPYNDAAAIEEALAADPTISAVLLEPVQGEAGVIVPDAGYLAAVRASCDKHNALLIADEIQCGLGRTGKMLAIDHDGVRPDVLILAKALSGGVYPVSCVLADDDVMLTIGPGQHGSTYGGNPVGCAVGKAALDVLIEEDLVANSAKMGEIFREGVRSFASPRVREVRGRGLMNAVVIEERDGIDAWQVCLRLSQLGLLAKPTHNNTIRFTPPLCIDETQMARALEMIERAVE